VNIMVKPTTTPANDFVDVVRRLYNPLGFSKGYNFVFWFITMGSASLYYTDCSSHYSVLIHLATSLASRWPVFNTSLSTASSATPTIVALLAPHRENAIGISRTHTRLA